MTTLPFMDRRSMSFSGFGIEIGMVVDVKIDGIRLIGV